MWCEAMKRVNERTAVAVLTVISVLLIVAGFIVPPLGVIDNSVLIACGILFAFAALWVAEYTIRERGGSASVRHGDTEIKVTAGDDED